MGGGRVAQARLGGSYGPRVGFKARNCLKNRLRDRRRQFKHLYIVTGLRLGLEMHLAEQAVGIVVRLVRMLRLVRVSMRSFSGGRVEMLKACFHRHRRMREYQCRNCKEGD